MLRNVTPLKESMPRPPNISDEHVSCIAPATRHASFQIFFVVPHLPLFLDMLQSLHALLAFDKVHDPLRVPHKTISEREKVLCPRPFLNFWLENALGAVHFFDISISKSGPKLVSFAHFGLEPCFAPKWHAFCQHLNF